MKKHVFIEHQIITIFKEGETGVKVKDLFRKYGILTPPTTTGNQNTVV